MKALRQLGWILLSLTLGLALWEAIAKLYDSPLLPSVVDVSQVFWSVVANQLVYEHLLASVWLVLQGFSLAVVIALPTSFLCSRIKFIANALLPVHEFIRYIPVPALVPLCAAIFGIGDLTKVVLIFVGTYFQLVFLLIANIADSPTEFEESARTLGLRGIKLAYKVTLPASSAAILDSFRISFAWAWSYLLVAEVVNATRGIGYLVLQSYRVLNMERLLILLVVIGVFGIVADSILKLVRKTLCPWVTDGQEKTIA